MTETMSLRERAAAAWAETEAMARRTAEARRAIEAAHEAVRRRDFATKIGDVFGAVVEPADPIVLDGLTFRPGMFGDPELERPCHRCGEPVRQPIDGLELLGKYLAEPADCHDCPYQAPEPPPFTVTVHGPPTPKGWVWLPAPVTHGTNPVLVNIAHILKVRGRWVADEDDENIRQDGSEIDFIGGSLWYTALQPAEVAKLIADAVRQVNGR